jgi:hypothetical protein
MRIAQDVIRRPAVHVGAEADCRLDAAHGRFTGDGALRPRWTNSPRLYPSEPPLLSPYFRRYISGNPSSNVATMRWFAQRVCSRSREKKLIMV